jgi:hypothetical protein
MSGLNAIAQRLITIKLGYCSPTHLSFDYHETLINVLESLVNPKLSSLYKLQIEELLIVVDELLSSGKVLKSNQYKIFEYDNEIGEQETMIIDRDLTGDFEGLENYITCTKSIVDQTETRLQKELSTYKTELTKYLDPKGLLNQSRTKSFKKPKGLLLGKFAEKHYRDTIINYKLNMQPLFLNAKSDRDNILDFLLSDNIELFNLKKIEIRLGLPLEYAIYFFDRLKEINVIITYYQSYIDKSQSIFCENGIQSINSLGMRTSLSALKATGKSTKNETSVVTTKENIKKIDDYIKLYFK